MLMRKDERQILIKRLVSKYTVEKQEDLVTLLQNKGIEVTQATVSRDIKELHLMKVPLKDSYVYRVPDEIEQDDGKKFEKLFRDGFIQLDRLEKFVLVKTIPGSAGALGKLLEKKYEKELFAVISNDENILMIGYNDEAAIIVKNQLLMLL